MKRVAASIYIRYNRVNKFFVIVNTGDLFVC